MDVSPKQLVSARGGAHSVPRARRRQPRAHGFATCSARPCRSCAPSRRSWAPASKRRSPRLRAHDRLAKRAGIVEERRRRPDRGPYEGPKRRGIDDFLGLDGARRLSTCEVPSAPTRTPASTRSRWCSVGTEGEEGRRPRRRAGHRRRRAGARAQRRSSPSCRGTATTSKTPSSCSERLVKEDKFTSIHIEEFECQVRDTKRGHGGNHARNSERQRGSATQPRRETASSASARDVEAGDILVGKVTPKGETELSPEERLLRAIFGEKAGDVRDASLKAPSGHERHRGRDRSLLAQGARRQARKKRTRSASTSCKRQRDKDDRRASSRCGIAKLLETA